MDSTDATTLVSVVKDAMVRMNLPMSKLRGQCYDGASVMIGIRSGVAKQIADIEPRAIFTHCYGHALNLAVADTVKQSKVMRNALETTYEIIKLIKYSPKREAILKKIKTNLLDAPNVVIRTLCPTRWTVRADALGSIISNYEVLQLTWEESVDVSNDTEVKARIHEVSAQMKTFDYLYGVILGEMVLKHSDNLSCTLQHKSMSAMEGHEISVMTIAMLKSLRNDTSFDLLWDKVNLMASKLNVDEPQLPRIRKKNPRGLMMVSLMVIFMRTQKPYTGRVIMK